MAIEAISASATVPPNGACHITLEGVELGLAESSLLLNSLIA